MNISLELLMSAGTVLAAIAIAWGTTRNRIANVEFALKEHKVMIKEYIDEQKVKDKEQDMLIARASQSTQRLELLISNLSGQLTNLSTLVEERLPKRE